jgi:hypothetical protein
MAVSGMRSSSASHTTAWVSSSVGTISRVSFEREMTVAASLGARWASDLIASISATTSTSLTPSSSSTPSHPFVA